MEKSDFDSTKEPQMASVEGKISHKTRKTVKGWIWKDKVISVPIIIGNATIDGEIYPEGEGPAQLKTVSVKWVPKTIKCPECGKYFDHLNLVKLGGVSRFVMGHKEFLEKQCEVDTYKGCISVVKIVMGEQKE